MFNLKTIIMKEANAFTKYIVAPTTDATVVTKPKLSTLAISPVGNVITLEQLVEWDNK